MQGNTNFQAKIVSGLTKVFPQQEPKSEPECTVFTALKNETISFQVAYSNQMSEFRVLGVSVDTVLAEAVKVRRVVCMPARYPTHAQVDDNYLSMTAGVFPDLLSDLAEGQLLASAGQWASIWVDVEVGEALSAAIYSIAIAFADVETGEIIGEVSTELTIYDAVLPPQRLIRTEWFHGDCLADYYSMEVFSEEHWRIMENFIAAGVKRGINMFLTPQFTPPLDTAKGGERTTIQLVEVMVQNGEYQFNFDRLERWVHMCQCVGVEYFEMSHLFSQWGAVCAPKVMATVNGEERQIFGWDTPAVGGEYTTFLQQYLPQLTAKLEEWGIAAQTYFHISDEPQLDQLESYQAAKASIVDYVQGYVLMDALSDFDFYQTGEVEKPVVANDHIEPFLQNGVQNLWCYYCTAQSDHVSNRFMAMPSQRNRIYGVQLYLHDIEGVLHWGYNFYNSAHSVYPINPYLTADCDGAFPAGDPFLVYPKADGTPEESIRMMVQDQAMADLRAMQYLEELTNRETVQGLIEEGLGAPISFSAYPKSDWYLLSLRNRINRKIADCLLNG